MNVVPAFAKIAVGIVVERRKAESPWIDFKSYQGKLEIELEN